MMIFAALLLAAPSIAMPSTIAPVRAQAVRSNRRIARARTKRLPLKAAVFGVRDCRTLAATGCGAKSRSPYRLPLSGGDPVYSGKRVALAQGGTDCRTADKRCPGSTHAILSADLD